MFRQVLTGVLIRSRNYTSRKFVSVLPHDVKELSLEVKLNEKDETFELYDNLTSGKPRKFDFPFVYLRDNCQVKELDHWCKMLTSSKSLSYLDFKFNFIV